MTVTLTLAQTRALGGVEAGGHEGRACSACGLRVVEAGEVAGAGKRGTAPALPVLTHIW